MGVFVNGKLRRTVAAASMTAAGLVLCGGVALATGNDNSDNSHEGGEGGEGGKNSSKCLIPVGLSAGALAGSGGEVDQCNSNGGNGGEGGAGDVDF